jgi:hypothetical protein
MTMLLERVGRSIDAITDKVVVRRPKPKRLSALGPCAHDRDCEQGEACIDGICLTLAGLRLV